MQAFDSNYLNLLKSLLLWGLPHLFIFTGEALGGGVFEVEGLVGEDEGADGMGGLGGFCEACEDEFKFVGVGRHVADGIDAGGTGSSGAGVDGNVLFVEV